MQNAKTLNWIALALGVWEILAAFVFGRWVAPVALWNAIIVGALIVLLSFFAERREDVRTDEGLDWAIAGVSLWLIISPFALGYDVMLPLAMWNDAIVGLVVMVLSLRATTILRREVESQRYR